jgi:competence transcription factor ComK
VTIIIKVKWRSYMTANRTMFVRDDIFKRARMISHTYDMVMIWL